jgi:transposase-like protein
MTREVLPSGVGSPALLVPETSEVERSETERGAGTSSASRERQGSAAPDSEVRTRRGRRTFPAEYKARILREADAARGTGEVGALLRREGLYSSHLAQWREQRDAERRDALAPRKRGPKGKSAEAKRIEQLEHEKAKLEEELRKANIIIAYQKKVHALLGIPLPEVPGVEER